MANSERTNNMVPSVTAKSNAGDNADVIVWADPSTHRLLVNASVAISGGSLTNNNAAPGATNIGVLPAVANAAAPTWTEGNQVLLSTDLSGQLRVTGSLSVGGTADGAAFTAGSSTGTTALGFYHSTIDTVLDGKAAAIAIDSKRNQLMVIRDAANNARGANVDANNNLGVVLAAETTKVIGTINIATSQTVGLAAGSQVIGHVIVDSGAINTSSATAPVSTMNSASAGSGINSAIAAVFDDVAPTAITENSFGFLRMSANRNQYVTIRDAAGNERGLNIDASGQLAITLASAQTLATVTTVSTVTNLSQMNGAALLMGNGVTGTGSQRVTVASDNTGVANWGHGATGAAVPAGATYMGTIAKTALPTAATDGNLTGPMADKFGRQVTLIGSIRDLTGTQTTTISASTSETTIVTAGAAGIFNDLVMLIVSNTSASTNTRIDFRDATSGTILFSLQSVGGAAPVGFALPIPIPQTTAANNWTAQCATSTTDVRIYAVFVKNK